jgi:hypothetical protein
MATRCVHRVQTGVHARRVYAGEVKARPALALLLALAFAACGASKTSEIRGAVWSPECGVEPGVCKFVRMAGATVEACPAAGGRCARARSAADGSYRLRIPRPGRYRLIAHSGGAAAGEYRTRARYVVVGSGEVLRAINLGRART